MDSQRIVIDLLAAGVNQMELAALVPCGQSTISSLKNGTRGTRISHTLASRLLALHEVMCADLINRRK